MVRPSIGSTSWEAILEGRDPEYNNDNLTYTDNVVMETLTDRLPETGEVWWFEFPVFELDKKPVIRPVLVINHDEYNTRAYMLSKTEGKAKAKLKSEYNYILTNWSYTSKTGVFPYREI